MNTFEYPYTDITLDTGESADGKAIALPPDKPCEVCAFITYTPGTGGRSLDITLQYGNQAGDWFDLPSDNTVNITDSTVAILSIPGGPTQFRLQYAVTGPAGPDDSIVVSISGLPTGTIIT